jgi:hypothetical protein
MYLRSMKRKNKDGTVAEYIQLAHNYRDPESKRPKPLILYNFGRREEIDLEGLRRFVRSINRFLGAEDQLRGEVDSSAGPFRFIESRPMGAAWLLRGLWERLGIGAELQALAKSAKVPDPEGLVGCILAMVVNRAIEPRSKHATPRWLEEDVFVADVPDEVYDERLYRAMDFLLSTEDELQKAVFFSTANLLNLEVDLLLYDTTSSYFEMEDDDSERAERDAAWQAFDRGEGPEPLRPRPQVVNDPVFRMEGHSRDRRPDLAQVVVGLAVTKEGIPVRCWSWPGNTNDAKTIAAVKQSLAGWKLHRVVWAVDRGMVSEKNLAELQRGGAHYLAGEKMRAGKAMVEEALSRPGRYKKVKDNVEVKEVVVGTGERRRRYVLVRNPLQIQRDEEKRQKILSRIEEELSRLPDGDEHTKAVCKLLAHPALGRYLKQGPKGEPVLDREKIKAEERLDGKYLVITSDDSLSAAEVALGYKQLLEVERAWRTLKTDLDLRPMHHRKSDRIRAHVLLCWLALLLVRTIEVRCQRTWRSVREQMDRMHRGTFENEAGAFVQCTEPTPVQRQYLKALEIPLPRRFEAIHLNPQQETEPAA